MKMVSTKPDDEAGSGKREEPSHVFQLMRQLGASQRCQGDVPDLGHGQLFDLASRTGQFGLLLSHDHGGFGEKHARQRVLRHRFC